MKLIDQQTIPAPRQRVWAGLNDERVLKQCIPGCESIVRKSDTELEARVVAKVGPVRAGFTGAVTLSDVNPPESYRISGRGQGGVAGFASGGAVVRLTEQGRNITLMNYDVEAQIGGKLAMLGSRLIDSTARSMAQQFFDRFVRIMSAQEGAAPRPKKIARKPKPARARVGKAKPVKKAATKAAKRAKGGRKQAVRKRS
jgi:carbon monoxide dehydrogenase subunit G